MNFDATRVPRISVGMPVYNGEAYLEEAIACVLGQSHDDFELIIADNASTDRTAEICRDVAARDARVRYIRNPENVGAAENYNKVFHLARAEFFRWMNADDRCDPELHRLCLAALEASPDVVLAYGHTGIIDADGRFSECYLDNLDLRQESAEERFVAFWGGLGLTNVIYGLMRTAAVAQTGLMGDGRYPAADIPFMAELALHGKFVELPRVLFYRRMHPGASSWTRSDQPGQARFWRGRGHAGFRWPLVRGYLACLRGIRRAPLGRAPRARLSGLMLRRMLWNRGPISSEIGLELRRLMRQEVS